MLEVSLINTIKDPKAAAKELLKSKGDTILYHTGSERMIIEMRNGTGLRGLGS